MKISTQIDCGANCIGEQKTIELIAKAGFDAWDFSMFNMAKYNYQEKCLRENDHPLASNKYLKFARELRKMGEDNGIHCNQSHAPFPSYAQCVRDYLKRAIECTAEAGGKICVIHPDNYATPQKNAEMYLELLPFAKGCGVKIATENMWCWDKEKDQASFAACATPESFNAHLDAVNDDYLVACLDIGHAEMRGVNTSAVEMIHALGPRLKALHIHDNDLHHDSHQIPFSMNINFTPIIKALKDINYDGYFTLEADNYLIPFTKDNLFEGTKNLANAARQLTNMFESL